MPTFAYVAVDAAGQKREGVIEAQDQKSAVARVTAEGRFVTSIKESASGRTTASAKPEEKKGGRPSRNDLALFTRRLSDLAGSGLPLDRVLQVLSEQTENAVLSATVAEALQDVRGGLPMSAAFAKHPRIFADVYTMTIRAGEASGQLPQACERLADLLENEVARRSLIISSLVYPIILTVTAVFVIIFLLTFVVPRLSAVFEGLGDALPVTTKILLGTSNFIASNWWQILLVVAALVFGLRAYFSTEAGQLVRDQFLLNAPVIKNVVQKSVVSRFARVLGTLVYGGVPILEALELAGLAAGNRVFRRSAIQVQDDVREGRQIGASMKDTGVFPPVLTHMVTIGEETGDLPKMLERVSHSLDFEVEQSLRRLTALVEPMIVLTMGGFVAFVVISVMLPIFQAQDLVK